MFMNIHPAVTMETRDYCAWQECTLSFVTGNPGFNCWTRRFPLTPAQVCGVQLLSKEFKIVCLFLSVNRSGTQRGGGEAVCYTPSEYWYQPTLYCYFN